MTIYGSIASSSFSTNTTINYTWDSGSLSSETLTISLSQIPVTGAALPADAICNIEGTLASATTTDMGSVKNSRINVTGTTTITGFGTGANLVRVVRFSGALTLTHNATSLILLGGASRTTAAGDVGTYGSDGSGNWRELAYAKASGAPVASTLPTQQILNSGSSATYTTPTGVRQLRIRMIGGGGGGGGASPSNDASTGGTGGTTSFNGVNTNGGLGGTNGRSSGNEFGGRGGRGGTGTANIRMCGNAGCSGISGNNSVNGNLGGTGGGSVFGGASEPFDGAPDANTGAGGCGGACGSSGYSGAGGGSGEYAELVINNPSSTYTYSIGAAGAAGTAGSGVAGTTGASGKIIVDEFY